MAGRFRRLAEQVGRVSEAGADVICLQEVTPRTRGVWQEALVEAGWPQVALAAADADATLGQPGRPLHVLTAARGPLQARHIPDLPWPERGLSTLVDGLEVVNLHSPISPKPGLVKVRTHEAVFAHLAGGRGPRLVCGDFNTPRREHPDGRVWTFARDQYLVFRSFDVLSV